MNAMSSSLKKLWNEWQLQAMVLLSLTLQIVLFLLGNRRRYINKIWIKIIVWPAYLLADFIATSALGLLTNRFVYHSGPLDAKLELTAFWAPFFLLHLGGPDTITAYSLEDNQLWSRHLLQLVYQTGFAFYIFFAGWTGSLVSLLMIPMMLAGLIKYGERTWVLWSASYKRRKASISSTHHTFSDHVEDSSDDNLLEVAYGMLKIAKSLFAGVPVTATKPSTLDHNHREITSGLEILSPEDAFKVIDMQLGFMYDSLYTKALVTYTRYGICLRFISFLLTSIVLVLFSSAPHKTHKYSKVDLCITFLLLAVAIVLELYAALSLLLSDHTLVWLNKHNLSNYIFPASTASLPLHRNPRWSNSMGQYSMVSYFLNEKPLDYFSGILNLLKLKQTLGKRQHAAYCQVEDDLKKWLVIYSKKYRGFFSKKPESIEQSFIKFLRAAATLIPAMESDNQILLVLTSMIEFQQTIIVWHIATELCYHLDHDYFTRKKQNTRPPRSAEMTIDEDENIHNGSSTVTSLMNGKISKRISRYLMYLVAVSPESLPASGAIGQINFKETCEEGRKEMESFESQLVDRQVSSTDQRERKREASKWLFERHKDTVIRNRKEMTQQLNGSLLSLGCVVANHLMVMLTLDEDVPEDKRKEKQWTVIAGVWFEFLLYAGRKCSGNRHAQQLRQGGDLLTHFWLLYEELEFSHESSTANSTSNV